MADRASRNERSHQAHHCSARRLRPTNPFNLRSGTKFRERCCCLQSLLLVSAAVAAAAAAAGGGGAGGGAGGA